MRELFFVTGNDNKVKELNILSHGIFDVKKITEIMEEREIIEDGRSFEENSLKKIMAYKDTEKFLIADDSGLEIDALGGEPGVQSARFLGEASYREKMEYIIKKIEGTDNRSARFVCSAFFYDPEENLFICKTGFVEGKISFEIRGTEGFGYDPFFIPGGYEKTFGELGKEIKNSISHRARAFKELFSTVQKILI
jgi:XTP/dITP diphosphohydrolase